MEGTKAQEAYRRRTEILMYKALAKKEEAERELRSAIRLVKRYELQLEDLDYAIEKAAK